MLTIREWETELSFLVHRRMEEIMDIYEYMEGYDRSFDEDEFDLRVWEYMQQEDFEMNEEFENFLKEYSIENVHQFLKVIRMKKNRKKFLG